MITKTFSLALAAILAPLQAAPWFDGADLSALDRIEELGGVFRDDKSQPTHALAALASDSNIHDTPGGRGIGVLWWHPDSIPVKGANIWMGGSCALWHPDGSPLPALGEFSRF